MFDDDKDEKFEPIQLAIDGLIVVGLVAALVLAASFIAGFIWETFK